jgi:antitoxin component YwqK of YwqJK toxin-antitoxin module
MRFRPNLPPSLLFLLLLCTCAPAPPVEEVTDEYGYRSEYTLNAETGEREGPARQYDPEGRLLAEENYRAGELDGLRTAYYPDGKVELTESYREGRFEGPYTTYDSLGNVRLRGQYVDGAMRDTWIRYWPDGRVRETVVFRNNRENGAFREWYANGEPRAAGTYADGKEQGILWQYNEAGELTTVRDCEEGICSAIWRSEEGGDPPVASPEMSRPPDAGATK